MRMKLRELFKIAEPVYQREVNHPDLQRVKPISRGILIALLIGFSLLFGVPMYLYPANSLLPNFPWSTAAAAVLFLVITLSEIIKMGALLSAALFASTLLSKEYEDNTAAQLLASGMDVSEIVRAKLFAILKIGMVLILIVTVVRLGLIVSRPDVLYGKLFTLTSIALFPAVPRIAALHNISLEGYFLLETILQQLSKFRMHWLWLPYYVVQPLLDLLLYATLGLFASAKSATRSNGLINASIYAVTLFALGYLGERLLGVGLGIIWLRKYGVTDPIPFSPEVFFGVLHSPPRLLETLWAVGLPIAPPGFIESNSSVPLLMLTVTLIVKIGLLWWLFRRTINHFRDQIQATY